jgi:hypothetical protein
MVELSMKISKQYVRVMSNSLHHFLKNVNGYSEESKKFMEDNLWAFQIARATEQEFTTLTPEGEKYLQDVFILDCNRLGLDPYTVEPLHSNQEIIDDEDDEYEDDDES